MTRPNKIIQFNLEERALQLRAKGLGVRLISRELTKLSGRKISHNSVWNFFTMNYMIVGAQIAKNEDYKNQLAKMHLDTMENFIDTIHKIDESIERHRDNWRAHTKFLGLKMRSIDMGSRLCKSVDPKEVKQKIDILSIKKAVDEETLRQLKGSEVKDGKLIVNNPALVDYYLKMKDSVE